MRKMLATCVAVAAFASFAQMALADAPTYSAQQAKAPIKIDGVLDDQWSSSVKVPMTPTDPVIKEFGTVWDDCRATGDFRVMWDDKFIYWGFSIKDAQLNTEADDPSFWQNDCVSGFLYDEEKEMNIKFFTAPRTKPYTLTGVLGAGVALNEEAVTGVKITKTGYDVEVALPWSAISNSPAKAGDTMAFTTLIIDKNDAWGQYMWVGDGDNAGNFATLKLVK